MRPTSFATYAVQPIGTDNPTTVAKAGDHSLRVLVNNVGPVVIFVADATTSLIPVPTTASYRIPPTEQHVFVLAHKQSLYAVGSGVGGLLSVTVSEIQVVATL